MSKYQYPLIHKLGLEIENDEMPGATVSAKDLEAALEKATVVVTDLLDPKTSWFNPEQWALFSSENPGIKPRYQGLLICVEELKKETVKVESIENYNCRDMMMIVPKELKGKKFKCTFEEIP